jgi:hypothetical protein
MRFGIGMNTDHTLEEVGQQFSVTRERIRQIEAKALRKLKHPAARASCARSCDNLMKTRHISAGFFDKKRKIERARLPGKARRTV